MNGPTLYNLPQKTYPQKAFRFGRSAPSHGLDNWASTSKKFIILGDVAHAIPPKAGQGVNQAFGDIYNFSLLLSKLSSTITSSVSLKFWQRYRQERVDPGLDVTRKMNHLRLPAAERENLAKDAGRQRESKSAGAVDRMRWLHAPCIEKEILKCVESEEGKEFRNLPQDGRSAALNLSSTSLAGHSTG